MANGIQHLFQSFSVWGWIIVLYLLAAFLTLLPTLRALFGKVKLNPGGPSFEKAPFSPATRKRLSGHYQRMQGTLAFWKREAARYGRFHYYSLWWTIISSSLMPFLTQAVDAQDPASKWLLTVISAHIVLALGFHRGLKVPELFRAFRLGESQFYDTYRRLLDQPETFGPDEATQVKCYFDDVEIIRKLVRNAETDNQPTVEDVRNQFSKPRDGV